MTLEELLKLFAKAPARLQEALYVIGDKLGEEAVDAAKSKLGTYQGPSGPNGLYPGWPPLAEETKERRVREGFSEDEPLLRSGTSKYTGEPGGQLRDSIEYRKATEGRSLVVTLVSNQPYAAAQEFGWENIPPRPYLRPAAHQTAVNNLHELAVLASFMIADPNIPALTVKNRRLKSGIKGRL